MAPSVVNKKYCRFVFVFFCLHVHVTRSQPVSPNVKELQNHAFPAFQHKFTEFSTRALQKDRLLSFFQNGAGSRTRRFSHNIRDRRQGSRQRRQTPQMTADEVKHIMGDLKRKVERRYSDAMAALDRLKVEFEKTFSRPPSLPRTGQTEFCCSPPGPPGAGTSAKFSYDARHQDVVNVTNECVGKSASALTPFLQNVDDTVRVMKDNYVNDTGLLWQYVTTVDGHFLQFPTKARHCDNSGHIEYPFTQPWMVDKLLQRTMNVVILLDASQPMSKSLAGRPGPPVTHLDMAKDAAKRVVSQLAFTDRVSVLVMNGTTATPPGCGERLLPITKRTSDIISGFMDGLQPSVHPGPDLADGLQTAYALLQAEKRSAGRQETNDVILILTNGEFIALNEDDLFRVIKDGQSSLNKQVTHMVYVIKSYSVTPAMDLLYKVADLNNIKLLPGASSWPPPYFTAVGPVGKVEMLPDSVAFQFKNTVAQFYTFLPRPANGHFDTVTANILQGDPKVGLVLTFAAPVYDSANKNLSSLHGAAAIEVSVMSLFDDVIFFKWRLNSYSFVLERVRGLVLVHPKLEKPSVQVDLDPIFTSLEVIEPTFSLQQREAVLAADSSVQSFDTQLVPGRGTYKAGMDLSHVAPAAAKVLYSRLQNTDYVLAVVVFLDEMAEDGTATLGVHDHSTYSLGFSGFALYHHQLLVDQTANGVCASTGDVRVMDKVTVKFSPEVFTVPELYMHSQEEASQVADMTQFLNHNAFPPSRIRPEVLARVVSDVRVVSSLMLSLLWRDTSNAAGVVGRLMGTRNGVFAAYPGISLPNAFAGEEYAWYRQSLARPGQLWVSLQRSSTVPKRRVVISTTVDDHDSIYGVVASVISRRAFAALFYNTLPQCWNSLYTCHLLTQDGYLLDVLDVTSLLPSTTQRHVTSVYPWLANELILRDLMKPLWCTILSKRQQVLTYVLNVPEGSGVSHAAQASGPCRHFLLYHVASSNLFLLSLVNRNSLSCTEKGSPMEHCGSCAPLGPNGNRCSDCPSTSSVAPVTSSCQCPCSCDVSFNVCQDSYRSLDNVSIPFTPCYEDPEMPSPTSTDHPLSTLPSCNQLCPTLEKKGECEAVTNCRWNDDDPYPVCDISTTTTTTMTKMTTLEPKIFSFGTTDSLHRAEIKNDGGSSLGGGGIAGIILAVAVVAAAVFLFAYYKLVKPRLFNRLSETGEEEEVQYHSQAQSLTISTSPAPATTAMAGRA